jgi:hypothetical protein
MLAKNKNKRALFLKTFDSCCDFIQQLLPKAKPILYFVHKKQQFSGVQFRVDESVVLDVIYPNFRGFIVDIINLKAREANLEFIGDSICLDASNTCAYNSKKIKKTIKEVSNLCPAPAYAAPPSPTQ